MIGCFVYKTSFKPRLLNSSRCLAWLFGLVVHWRFNTAGIQRPSEMYQFLFTQFDSLLDPPGDLMI